MSGKEDLIVHASYRGTGRAYEGEQFVAEVDYLLKEVEESLDAVPPITRPAGGSAGARTIYGFIKSPSAESLYNRYLGKVLTLHCEDGRALDFSITQKPEVNACLVNALRGFTPEQPPLPPGTPLPLWEDDAEFQAIRRLMEGHTLVGVNDSYMLYQFALQTSSLPGDVAEVGVYKGGTAKLLAKAVEAAGKDVHLFDTFSGMPPTDSARDLHRQGDFGDVTYEEVQEYLSDCPHAHLYQGIFPDTAAPVEGKSFCLVHVDVDIYTSVLASCQFFYPRLVSGGVIVFDDYGRLSCPGAKAAVDEFFADKAERPIYSGHSHSAQAFVIKI